MPITNEMNLREASYSDIPILSLHHKNMFLEIWEQKGDILDPERAREVEIAYMEKLKAELASGDCIAWLAEDTGKIVASGAITIVSFVPNPSDLSPKVAYLHSMYTEKPYRNKQLAQKIIQRAIGFCKSNGIKRILLNASDAGKPIYQKLGFLSASDTMRLFISN